MKISRSNIKGIDEHIDKLQSLINSKLITAWSIADDTYKCYPRCYRNAEDNGYIAENYEGAGEYKEVYLDDTLKAISFFGIGNNIPAGAESKAEIHLVFFVNIDKVKPGSDRRDEEVRLDVYKILNRELFGFQVKGIITGLENVLREYPGSRRDDRLKNVDMHPFHCFRFDLELTYQPLKCY